MPRFKVKVLKRVLYTAVVEIEAANAFDAEEIATERAASEYAPDWEDEETEELWAGPAQQIDE